MARAQLNDNLPDHYRGSEPMVRGASVASVTAGAPIATSLLLSLLTSRCYGNPAPDRAIYAVSKMRNGKWLCSSLVTHNRVIIKKICITSIVWLHYEGKHFVSAIKKYFLEFSMET